MDAVDVIVATRNRPRDLQRLIPSILEQTHRGFRLILVDQSDDARKNGETVRAFADERIEHLVQAERGKTKALNLALRRTSAPTVAFTDDDCTAPADWLEKALLSVDRTPRAGVIFGSLIAATHDRDDWFIPELIIDHLEVLRGPVFRSHGLVGLGANMIIRREVFGEIGMFDEDLGTGGDLISGEECEITYRALRNKIAVLRDPALRMTHWGARRRSDGSADALINAGTFGVGAGYGKHIRAGDLGAVAVVAHETVWPIAEAAWRRRRPLHVRRLGLLWRGIAAGFRRGPRIPEVRLSGVEAVEKPG